MRIVDLLRREGICLGATVSSRDEAFDKLIGLQAASGNLTDEAQYRRDILAREELGTTAVGAEVAIPHAKSDAVRRPGLSALTLSRGISCGAPDGSETRLLFMIASPPDGDVHLEVLARLMALVMDGDFCRRLLAAGDAEEFLSVINRAELEKYPEDAGAAPSAGDGTPGAGERYRVLAVTACPTGIAHTYMAAEALERAGREMGIPLKAETNGSGGAKNVLTARQIEEADGIIIAADKTVDMQRFDGKRVLSVKVSDGIRKPRELIQKVIGKEAPVYHFHGEKRQEKRGGEHFGRRVYKHLMNGVSHMLPFVVAGGIFIALAFLIDTLAGAPQDADFGVHTPAAAFFKTVGGVAFNFMIPILAGYIAQSIADRPGLLVGFVGGFLATTGATFASVGGDVPSGFLGALFAGFAGGYLMLGLRKLCEKLPRALEGIKSVLLYPLAGLLMIAVLMCALNPFMGWINTAISDLLHSMGGVSRVLLGAVLGMMMAIDMGGPFNKAAYVFGTAAIASGNYDVMAAVMVGGMVPPLAIALATTFFGNRFPASERKSGPVNYILGLSFITEGAIPYAASDPLRVIPSCMVGAGIAGGLSMWFRCTLMAPHGGIFVFAVVGNWALYLLSLAVGSLAGMLMLALLKRPIHDKEAARG